MSCDDRPTICIRPTEADICLTRATTNTIEFVLTNAEGESVNIQADTVKLTVRDGPGGEVKIAKENGPGEHVNDAEGRTEFTIDKTEIETDVSCQCNTYWDFEVRRIDSSGGEFVHIEGRMIIAPGVGAAP